MRAPKLDADSFERMDFLHRRPQLPGAARGKRALGDAEAAAADNKRARVETSPLRANPERLDSHSVQLGNLDVNWVSAVAAKLYADSCLEAYGEMRRERHLDGQVDGTAAKKLDERDSEIGSGSGSRTPSSSGVRAAWNGRWLLGRRRRRR